MAMIVPSPWRWRTRRFILAAMLGTIATSAAIIAISVVLRPAHIYFFITQASMSRRGEHLIFNLTLAVNNPSRRAGVLHRSISVSLYYYNPTTSTQSGPPRATVGAFIPARIEVPTPFFQPRRNTTTIPASVSFDPIYQNNTATMSVKVKAKVQFKAGLAFSRPYGIMVACKHVNFTHFNTNVPVTCSG